MWPHAAASHAAPLCRPARVPQHWSLGRSGAADRGVSRDVLQPAGGCEGGGACYDSVVPGERCADQALLVLTGRFSGREARLRHHVIHQRNPPRGPFAADFSSTSIFLSFFGGGLVYFKPCEPRILNCV